jgi:hypothetical protein
MHVHIGFLEFLIFGMYLLIWKLVLHFVNVESRRNGWHVPAGVSGLLA